MKFKMMNFIPRRPIEDLPHTHTSVHFFDDEHEEN
jgi:hypothetical protein